MAVARQTVATSHGKVRWLSHPPHGVARLRVDSDAFQPGELLAAAYSAFLASDVAERLERNGVPATELVVQAWCRLSPGSAPRSVKRFDVEVHGRVPGIDEERLRCVAAVALASCHTSIGMRHDLRTKLHVSLEH
jgi:organic hydroperoxide reductase OsmC/OhrA